jgi:hypothetical protein
LIGKIGRISLKNKRSIRTKERDKYENQERRKLAKNTLVKKLHIQAVHVCVNSTKGARKEGREVF